MSKRTRRHHSPDQKIDMLRRHLVEKAPVSAVCEEAELQPSVFYIWQRQLFTNGAQVFVESRKRQDGSDREAELLAEIERLKARVVKKDEVIAAVTSEMVSLKKELGEL